MRHEPARSLAERNEGGRPNLLLAVHAAAGYLATRVAASLALAATERVEAEAARTDAEQALAAARANVRRLTGDFESLVDSAHRNELARAEQRMRVDALVEKAMTELGLRS